MSLKEQLDTIRTGAEKQIPPPLLALMHQATRELFDSGAARGIITAGSVLPDFELTNQNGDLVTSDSILSKGPLVLSVYRGLW